MTYQEIDGMIGSMGFPYAYYQFKDDTVQGPPFICWFLPGTDDLFADNKNFQAITRLIVEFYAEDKSFAAEKGIEDVLTAAGLSFSKDSEYLDSEKMQMTTYEMEVVING